MKKLFLIFLLGSFLYSGDFIQVQSQNSVKATMDKIEASLKKRGYYIFARVNHPEHIRKNSSHDIDEDTETILFDKPTATKHMFAHSSAVMVEVPFKIGVSKNIDDEVFITYKNVDVIIEEHGMQECKFLQKGLRKDLKQIAEAASLK